MWYAQILQCFQQTIISKIINLPTLGGKQTALMINSQLSRCSAARGSSTGVSLVGPAKVKAHKSFLCIEGFPEVEIKDI